MLKLFVLVAYVCLLWCLSLLEVIREIDARMVNSPKKMKIIKIPKWFKLPIPKHWKKDEGFNCHPEAQEEGKVFKYTFILTLLHYISTILIAPIYLILFWYFNISPFLMFCFNLGYVFIVLIVTGIIFFIKKV